MRFLVLLWLPAFLLSPPACSPLKPGKPSTPENKTVNEGPELVGRIASIPPDKRFVLIQSYGSWKIEAGTVLTTRGLDDRTANLLVTGEALGQFAAADIQSGAIEIGDGVYSQNFPKPSNSPETTGLKPELTENQLKEKMGTLKKNN